MAMADDDHDGHPSLTPNDPFPDRVAIGPELAGHRFVDHSRKGRLGCVLTAKSPALQKRDAHCGEIGAADRCIVGPTHRTCISALEGKTDLPVVVSLEMRV